MPRASGSGAYCFFALASAAAFASSSFRSRVSLEPIRCVSANDSNARTGCAMNHCAMPMLKHVQKPSCRRNIESGESSGAAPSSLPTDAATTDRSR